jgi:hypothetical protein
LVEQNV